MPRSPEATIVISRDGRGAGGVRSGFEDALADALRPSSAEVLVVPHLYHLRASHPAAATLMDARGHLVVCSWLPPRAAFWTLHALGVKGAPAAAENSEERTIRCVNLADFASVADAAAALAVTPPRAGAVREIAEAVSPRWYPVLDYSRCISCRKCADFCLFGVYAIADDNVIVAHPDHCKPGCPACARTCPERAIIFPHYFADPAIAGAETPAASAAAPSPAAPIAENSAPGDLDHLITSLEKLDG